MEKPESFSISYWKCDLSRNKGGDIMKLDDVILSTNEHKMDRPFAESDPPKTEFSKKPNHYEHATRNVLLKNGMRRKFHIRLLREFNGKKVFY
mgnify:CR=1 FL=1